MTYALLELARPRPGRPFTGPEDLGDPERPAPVVLGDRDVLTDEPVTIEPEDRLLFLVAHAVVMERPVVATVMDEAAVHVVLADPEPMHGTVMSPGAPFLRIEMSVTRKGGDELVTALCTALGKLGGPRQLQADRSERSWLFDCNAGALGEMRHLVGHAAHEQALCVAETPTAEKDHVHL